MNAAGKRKKRSKKKSEEKTKELITPQDTLTEVKEDEKQENTTIQKKESVKEAEDIIDLVVNDSIFSSRNEEIDLDDEDDDDVPSELLSVEWKNPSLNVESELTDVLDIIEPAHSTISLNNLDNEAQVSLQTGLSEHFFETPLVGEGGNSSPQRDSDEHNSVPKECVTYTSAWGPCIAPELSDDDESVEVRISTPMVKVEVQDNEEVIPNDAALNISLEQWVKESLKDIPAFVDSTLTTLTSQNILSVTSLLSNAEYSGVKGLKQLGLGTPAAWALHASLEIIRSSTALHPEPSLVEDRLNTPRDNSNEEKNSEESNQVNRRWGYTLDVDSSDGESMDDENNHTEKETSVPRTISVYSWRRKYVTVDSSSSSDDEEKDCECSRSEEQ